jgi:glutamate synthase domain-containing protein 2/glutamate synthase domain-containing protein 1/glutamate synthase domain-containing protein 3
MEHRGGVGPNLIGDGAGIMTSIPYELFNREAETFAVAFIFCPQDPARRKTSLKVFEETFWQYGLKLLEYREVPINSKVISPKALKIMPHLVQAIIERPTHCRTLYSFERLLYQARQNTRTKEKENGINKEFFFSSLSPRNIVYKALCRGPDLREFYLDLKDPRFKTSFALFHRRFSTNTISTWDKTQPFRLIAHNGEINTIEGNRAWAITREKDLGLRTDELITHEGISDSGNLNGIAEGLRYRSSIPKLSETLAILIPPANTESSYYKFWSRGMEPWDGPAMIAFSDGKHIGARLDRNGFRPSRWQKTDDHFYLASEAGVFRADPEKVLSRGALSSGESVTVNILSGALSFLDAKDFPENKNVHFDPRAILLGKYGPTKIDPEILWKQKIFNFSKDEIDKIIIPMASTGKEPIGSMGDTASLAVLSLIPRSLFDFFYQHFAQVTNPPIDYIREKIVTDMKVFLGRKPNIFEAKDFIPLKQTLEIDGPVLSLGQLDVLSKYNDQDLHAHKINITFHRDSTLVQFNQRLNEIRDEAIHALRSGKSLLILSDRLISDEMLPIPSLLALTYLNSALNETGRRLRTSLILEVGDVRNPHQLACLISYGASSVCPYMAIETILNSTDPSLINIFPEEREIRFIKVMKEGVLKIMSKRGISVLRSYQGSKLFTPVGLGQDVLNKFFKGEKSIIGGYSLETLLQQIKNNSKENAEELQNKFLYKEQASQKMGETHSLTSQLARLIHKMLNEVSLEKSFEAFKNLTSEIGSKPILIRHLLDFNKSNSQAKNKILMPVENILQTFGSGAMSFGAISAESQRDLILAFREINGRSNSGEGGENPYYYSDGITAKIKQIASGRFGVTAEYLVNGEEVQIKIAQGAKPGEGGQLMGVKVTEDIAKARFTTPGIDLISPAPQHDIYSIEDLKQLIYEIKELHSTLKVSVKLVSSENIGAIAVGVVKAGADIIQISGGDGGTGAATLLSMKHAGLPLEIGLIEVHRELVKNGLRDKVILRADGGFITGKDIVIAACLGADEFDFGKLVLVGQGCIMARICEKNTCPTGIATQSPKFKAFYKGNPEKVVRLLQCLALEVQEILSDIGVDSLKEIRGKNNRLKINEKHRDFIQERNLNLTYFTENYYDSEQTLDFPGESRSILNQQIILDLESSSSLSYSIKNTDRAIPASLSGLYALKKAGLFEQHLPDQTSLKFTGSAGQGFGVFNVSEVDITLEGEANDSVAKGMSGGKITIKSNLVNPNFIKEENSIIGNCALYGATGGTLFVHGKAGDRFAVRNSGAVAIVEGVGFHACEYMSGGLIWILGETKGNLGAGMSGGSIYTNKRNLKNINLDYIIQVPINPENTQVLITLGQTYLKETQSLVMKNLLEDNSLFQDFIKLVPIKNLFYN